MTEIRLKVKGMKCGGCVKNVEGAVKTIPGVVSVKADLKTAEVLVIGDGADVTTATVRKKIEDAGYKPE